jgi:aminoglycoside phosphotransferase (APT) family kinase protein
MSRSARLPPVRLISPETLPGLIADRLSAEVGRPVIIEQVEQRSEGWSQYTFVALCRVANEPVEWVIRVDPGRNMWSDSASLERQFRVLTVLSGQGVPAPRPVAFLRGIDGDAGAALVMEKLPGEPIVPWSKRGREVLAQAREAGLQNDFAAILAAIHASRWPKEQIAWLADKAALKDGYAAKEIHRWSSTIAGALWRPDPVAEVAFGWLEDNLPRQQRWAVVHGDFRTGNLLFQPGRISGVLDWESADWGDPLADIGYACAPPHVIDGLCCGLAHAGVLVAAYERYARVRITASELLFYRLLATLKNHAIWTVAAGQALRGDAADLRTARGVMAAQNVRAMLLSLLPSSTISEDAPAEHPILESPSTRARLLDLAAATTAASLPDDTFGTGQLRAAEALRAAVAGANPPVLVNRYRGALADLLDVHRNDSDIWTLEALLVERLRQARRPGWTTEPWFETVVQTLGVQFVD